MKKILRVIVMEIREALPAILFFLVAFNMIAVTKTVILEDFRITPTSTTVASVAALIVGKVILIVEKLPVARLFSTRKIYNVLWKTVLFGLVAIAFRLLEELVPVLVRHGSAAETLRHMADEVSWAHFWVTQMWLFSLLFMYCLATELARTIGTGRIRAMLVAHGEATAD